MSEVCVIMNHLVTSFFTRLQDIKFIDESGYSGLTYSANYLIKNENSRSCESDYIGIFLKCPEDITETSLTFTVIGSGNEDSSATVDKYLLGYNVLDSILNEELNEAEFDRRIDKLVDRIIKKLIKLTPLNVLPKEESNG